MFEDEDHVEDEQRPQNEEEHGHPQRIGAPAQVQPEIRYGPQPGEPYHRGPHYDDLPRLRPQPIQDNGDLANDALRDLRRRVEDRERRNDLERQIEELRKRVAETPRNRHPVMKPSKFHLGKDNFRNFLSSFRIFARAANIPPEREIENMLCCLDEKAQRRVETLRLTKEDLTNPAACYEKLTEILSGSEARAQAKMQIFDMKQSRGESVTDFATRLLDKADLAYGVEEDSLRDRILLEIFVRGLLEDKIAYDLLKEQLTDFDTAYKHALDLEGIYNVRKSVNSTSKDRLYSNFRNNEEEEILSIQNRIDELQINAIQNDTRNSPANVEAEKSQYEETGRSELNRPPARYEQETGQAKRWTEHAADDVMMRGGYSLPLRTQGESSQGAYRGRRQQEQMELRCQKCGRSFSPYERM